jgi:hypothetical protein
MLMSWGMPALMLRERAGAGQPRRGARRSRANQLASKPCKSKEQSRSPALCVPARRVFLELAGSRRVLSAMLSLRLDFYLHYYFATLCVPAVIVALFVIYLFLKDRNKRL